jgi:hypothetical protein
VAEFLGLAGRKFKVRVSSICRARPLVTSINGVAGIRYVCKKRQKIEIFNGVEDGRMAFGT